MSVLLFFCFFLTDVINFCLGYPENHSADFWGKKKQNIFVKQKICAAGFQFDIKNISCAGLDFLFFFSPRFCFYPKTCKLWKKYWEKKKKSMKNVSFSAIQWHLLFNSVD